MSLPFCKQRYSAHRILRTEHDFPVPLALIGKLFGIDRGTIRNHAQKYAADLNRIGSPGHPAALPQNEAEQIVAIIMRFSTSRLSALRADGRLSL
jgi:hypothetical protein